MNKCNLIRDLLPLYVDDALSQDGKEYVERHIKTCANCANAAKKLNASIPKEDLLASILPDANGNAEDTQKIKNVKRKFNRRTLWISLISAFLCATVLFCGLYIPDRIQLHNLYLYPRGVDYEYFDDDCNIMLGIELIDPDPSHKHPQPPKEWYCYEMYAYSQSKNILETSDSLFHSPIPMEGKDSHWHTVVENEQGSTVILYTDTFTLADFAKYPYLTAYCKDADIDIQDPIALAKFCMEFQLDSVNFFTPMEKVKVAGEIRELRHRLTGGCWGAYDKNEKPLNFPQYYYPFTGDKRGYAVATVFSEEVAQNMYDMGGTKWDYNGDFQNTTDISILGTLYFKRKGVQSIRSIFHTPCPVQEQALPLP